ncbi:MAG TPA: Ig-like domain-containing protein [Gemmataceae bacterium]|nr:Ig-like domain-containing protein [Gemmataceae bacterium]
MKSRRRFGLNFGELEARVTPVVAPGGLLIYYGYPSIINGTNTTGASSAVFGQYSYAVLGANLELAGHPDHANTVAIMNNAAASGTKFFGYIDLGVSTNNYPTAEIHSRIDAWKTSGADGIFLDDFGYDFGVSRARQNDAVNYAHTANLPVVANGWVIADVLGAQVNATYNPSGVATSLLASDYYLYESFQVTQGSYVTGPAWRAKADALAAARTTQPIQVLSVTTTTDGTFDQAKFDYAYWSAALDDHVGFGWGEQYFSASSGSAPYRTRPNTNLGATLTGPVDGTLPLLTRNTNTGRLAVDASVFKGGFNVIDYGDAPDSYGSTLADDGARHIVGGPRLGSSVDFEDAPLLYMPDQPNGGYGFGDNVFGEDEAGVAFSSFLQAGQTATAAVDVQNAPSGAKADGWIDFNRDGDFNDAGERIFNAVNVNAGINSLTFAVPANAQAGQSFARIRLSTAGLAAPNGLAADGEVEDYAVLVNPSAGLGVIVNAILDHRLPNGVLRTSYGPSFYEKGTNDPYYILDPYFSTIAVRSLLAAPNVGTADKYAVAVDQLNFWLDQRRGDGTIPRVIVNAAGVVQMTPRTATDDTVYDPNALGADADDSALALILSLAADLQASGGPTAVLTTRYDDLVAVGATLSALVEADGLPRPFVDIANPYKFKQTLDCTEVRQALDQFAGLLRDFYHDPSAAAAYAGRAATVAAAIETNLFDPATQLYRQYKGAATPNLNVWYPMVYDQVWPIITGQIAANSAKARALLNAVYATWNGSANISWTARTDAGFLAWAALQAGDTVKAAASVQSILPWALQNTHPSPATPLTIADYGFLLRALLPSLAGPSATTFTENGTPTPITPALIVSNVDSQPLVTATITLINLVGGEDVLAFTNTGAAMGNIAVQSNIGGVLKLTSAGPTATPAQWQTALRAVTYANTSENPTTTQRTLTMTVSDGISSSNAIAATVTVVAVNDAPVAMAASVTTNEDTAKTFTIANFSFTDVEGNSLASITVSGPALATGDTLKVDQGSGLVNVMNGMTITAAQIPTLKYTPALNGNGAARSTFDFKVNDADPGMVEAMMTINVTAVNDVPVAQPSSVTTNEDTGKTFAVSDFNYADAESDALASIKVSTLTLASGDTLKVDQGSGLVDVTNGMTITAAQISTMVYASPLNANGNARSKFDFGANDVDSGTVSATMTINVTAVNDVPVAQPSSVMTNEDTAKTFAVGDFTFTDVEGNGLASITIGSLSLATSDSLTVDQGAGAIPVTTGMIITAAQIPTLTYMPILNTNGAAPSSFDFKVNDADPGSVTATMTIDVDAVNDVPVAQASSVATNEDTAKTFAVSDFNFTDVEGNGLVAIEIVALNLTGGDTLKVDRGAGMVTVTTGMTITAAQIPTLTYMPAANANGAALSSFDFTVDDADQGTVSGTMTMNVTPVNDVPVAIASSVFTNEDTPKTFAITDFLYTDVESNSLASITISSVTLTGSDTLTVDQGAGPVAVTVGMTITAAHIPTLTYTPALNANGVARSTFGVKVNDANPGTTAATMTINVIAVNDAPVAQPSGVSTKEDVVKTFTVADFPFTDVEGNALTSITVSGLALASGDTLTVNQGAGALAVTNGMIIMAVQIPSITYTPALGGYGAARSTFNFTVNDADPGTVSATVSINVVQQTNLQFQSATFTTAEDGAGVAHVTVTRLPNVSGNGPVTVDFTTSDGTAISSAVGANPKDYTTTTQTLSWADGDFTPQTIDIPISDDSLNEGKESIHLILSNATGNGRLGALATAVLYIKPSDGIVINGTDKKPQGVSTDTDGDLITMKLTGKVGTATYYRTDTDGDGKGPIELIDVAGTDPAVGEAVSSMLTITTAKPKGGAGDGFVNVGAITGSTLKSITAKKSDLDGDGINMTGYVGAVTMKDVKNGADIMLEGAAPTAKSAVKIKVGVIDDGTDIDVKAPVASVSAANVGVGTITAPSIGTLTVAGKAKTKTAAAIPGDFASNLTLSGVGVLAGKPTLKTMTVKGAVTNANIDVHGAITSITVGSFINSRLYGNYAGADDGSGVFTAGGDVGTFKVTGKINAFAHSFVIASNFKNVSIGSIDPANGGTKFGVTADNAVKALAITGLKFKYNAKTGGTQDLTGTDFEVKVV